MYINTSSAVKTKLNVSLVVCLAYYNIFVVPSIETSLGPPYAYIIVYCNI